MSESYEIETSITRDYRADSWGIERIVLDGISNHLPSDNDGTVTSVKFKQEGHYVDLSDVDPDKHTEKIVFEDNGSGYEAGLLGVLFSTKTDDPESIGQFGEGLKLVAAAALREGLDLQYVSKNWRATPFFKPTKIGKHELDKLCFQVSHNGDQMEGSRTIFTNPNQQLVDEVLRISQNVLAFNHEYEELFRDEFETLGDHFEEMIKRSGEGFVSTMFGIERAEDEIRRSEHYHSRIINIEGDNAIYVKGIKIHNIESIFSYDLGLENISPDRSNADSNAVLDEIQRLLRKCTNEEVIKEVLDRANKEPDRWYKEYQALSDRSLIGRLHSMRVDDEPMHPFAGMLASGIAKEPQWVAAFYKMFGKEAVIESDHYAKNEDAKILGYTPVKMNAHIANVLMRNGVMSAEEISNTHEYRWVDKVTEEEQGVLAEIPEMNEYVAGEAVDVRVRVYSGLFTATGREIESDLGVHIREEDGTRMIGIKRDVLQDAQLFRKTYIHELGHHLTGAEDADRRFAGFFIVKLAEKYTEQREK